MKRYLKTFSALLLSLVLLLSACGESSTGSDNDTGPLHLTVRLGESQTTPDCAKASAKGSETILYHLYENLMRWEDDGNGYAVLAPGQAEEYTVELDYAGNATYTFKLRSDIKWSDGEAVTAHHFAAAWKRLADPANELPGREILSIIAGYDQFQTERDPDLLGISAPDAQTFTVTLNGNPPRFLETVCAGIATMPIRHNPPNPNNIVTNGGYIAEEFSSEKVVLTRSKTYYDAAAVTVERITVLPSTDSQSDYDALLNDEVHLVENLPLAALQELNENGNWISEPVTTTLALAFNTLSTPLDSAEVRAALHLVVDEQAIVAALADCTTRPAMGLIPYGVSDFSARKEDPKPQETEQTLPDPNAPPKETVEEPAVYWDFRTHSEEIVTVSMNSDYAADCSEARALLAKAGYPDGKGLPILDYVFLNTEENVTIAKILQAVWKEQLGVNVTLRAMTEEDLAAMLTPAAAEEDVLPVAPFQIAAIELSADYSDAGAFLFRWHSANPENYTGYTSPAFDILLGVARDATTPDAYDAYLHDAEAILLADAPLVPICYRGGSFLLSEKLTGLYRAPNGIYFFSGISRK